jgi:hypothetical protein
LQEHIKLLAAVAKMNDLLEHADSQLRKLRAANYAIEQDLVAKGQALEVDYVGAGLDGARA